MIVVRDVFKLKFGAAKEALAAFKEVGDVAMKSGFGNGSFRVLTDLVGSYYTLVLETSHQSLADYEKMSRTGMSDENWRTAYKKFTPYVESGYREILSVVQSST
jgi:hypothetical protein